MSNYEENINYQENDHEEETFFNENDEEPSTPKNIYKSIYDDDDFEQDTQWESKGMYNDITNIRRRSCKAKNQDEIKPSSVKASHDNDNQEPEKVLNLPKGGWKVQKVEIEVLDFSPIPSKVVFKTPKTNTPITKFKWKKLDTIFSENAVGLNFIQQQTPAPPPPPPAKTDDGFSPARKPRPQRRLLPQANANVQAITQSSPIRTDLKNTQMCNFRQGCKRKDNGCNFAHDMDSFNPTECRFQAGCKKMAECSFKHSTETKEAFLERTKMLKKNRS